MKKALLIGLIGFLCWNPVRARALETPATDAVKVEKPERPPERSPERSNDCEAGEDCDDGDGAQDTEHGGDRHPQGTGIALVEALIPITAIVGFFATIILAVIFPLIIGHRRRGREIELQKLALEKGVQVIPEVPQAEPVKPRNDKRTGILLIGVGLAIIGPTLVMADRENAALGLAPIFLGLMYLVSGKWFPPSPSK